MIKIPPLHFFAPQMLALVFSEVVSLTPETFDNYPLKFVKFFAPWCGHCKSLAPDWIKLSETDIQIPITEVDCEATNGLCGEHGVRGFPTIKLFNGDSVYDYEGARSVDALRSWAETMLKPTLSYIDEKVALEEVKTQKIAFIVYTNDAEKDEKYFEPVKGKAKIYTVKSSAKKMVAYREGLTFELNKFTYSSVEKFFNQHNKDLFPEVYDEALSLRNQLLLIIDRSKHAKILKECAEAVKELYKNNDPLVEKVTFSYLPGNYYKDKLEKDFAITDLPGVLAITDGKKSFKAVEYDSAEEMIDMARELLKKSEL